MMRRFQQIVSDMLCLWVLINMLATLKQTERDGGINMYFFIFYAFCFMKILPYAILSLFVPLSYFPPRLRYLLRFFWFFVFGVLASLMALRFPTGPFNLLPGFIFVLALIYSVMLSALNYQPTEGQHHCQSASTNALTETYLPPHLQTVIFADEVEANGNAGSSSLGKAELSNQNQGVKVSKQRVARENDYDPMLTELKATALSMTTNGVSSDSHKMGDAKTSCNIVKLIKPLSYSASISSNIPDILVTFLSIRSDGTEVEVDNKYLKANNPLLLIDFYEQRLQSNLKF